MNLNNLIEKIIYVNIYENNYKNDWLFCSYMFFSFIIVFLSLIFFFDYSSIGSFLLSLLFSVFNCIFFIITQTILPRNNIFYTFLYKKLTKSLKLTEEEKKIIHEYSSSYEFMINFEFKNSLLNYLIKKNINTIEINNLEQFIDILKINSNLYKKYLPVLFDKIVDNKNIIQVIYPNHSDVDYQLLSKEELLLSKILNNDPTLKNLIIESISINFSLNDIIENEKLREELSIEQIAQKLLERYTLKEITNTLFSNSSLNNQLYDTEISTIICLLNNENKLLITKFIIEKVLKKQDKDIIEDCYVEFFNCATNLNVKNKLALYEFKDQFPKEQVIFNNNLKIINI